MEIEIKGERKRRQRRRLGFFFTRQSKKRKEEKKEETKRVCMLHHRRIFLGPDRLSIDFTVKSQADVKKITNGVVQDCCMKGGTPPLLPLHSYQG